MTERERYAIEVELITIDAHCYVLNDPGDDDDPVELVACIKACVQRVRDLLDVTTPPAPVAAMPGS